MLSVALILLLYSACVDSANYVFKPEDISSFLPDDNATVLAIDSMTGYTLVVVTTQHILWYGLSALQSKGEILAKMMSAPDKISLPAVFNRTHTFVEAKLLNHDMIVLCDVSACSVCLRSENRCRNLKLNLLVYLDIYSKLEYASVTLNNNHIVMRTIDSRQKASILLYELNDTQTHDIDAKQIILEKYGENNPITLEAVSYGMYSYFVGSSVFTNYMVVPFQEVVDLKMIRVSFDESSDLLDSRIDVRLLCDGTEGTTGRIHAAYITDGLRLVFITKVNGASIVCHAHLPELNTHLENFNEKRKANSSGQENRYQTLIPRNGSNIHIFDKFIDSSSFPAKVIHRLDDIKHFDYEQKNPVTITYDVYLHNWHLAYVDEDMTYIYRISDKKDNQQLSVIPKKIPMPPSKHYFTTLERSIFYILGTTIEHILPVCNMYYKSCESVADNMENMIMDCVWCADYGNEGAVVKYDCEHQMQANCTDVSIKDSMTSKSRICDIYKTCGSMPHHSNTCLWCADAKNERAISKDDTTSCSQSGFKCPPIIHNVTIRGIENGVQFDIFGMHLTDIDNTTVDVFGEVCSINDQNEERIQCNLKSAEKDSKRGIQLSGKLEGRNFTKTVNKEKYICVDSQVEPDKSASELQPFKFIVSKSYTFAATYSNERILVHNYNYKQHNNTRITLEINITEAENRTSTVLSVEFVNYKHLVYCVTSLCRICSFERLENNMLSCNILYSAEITIGRISSADFVRAEDAMALRVVNDDREPSIFLYSIHDNVISRHDPKPRMVFNPTIALQNYSSVNSKLLESFSSGRYIYYFEVLPEMRKISDCYFVYTTFMLTRIDTKAAKADANSIKTIAIECGECQLSPGNINTYFDRKHLFLHTVEEKKMGTIRRYHLSELEQYFESIDKLNNLPISGTIAAKYTSLPGSVLKITLPHMSPTCFLTTENGTYWISLSQFDAQVRQIPKLYNFDEEYLANPKHILEDNRYLVISETEVTLHEYLCSGYYDTCESFSGRLSEPLNCSWCVDTSTSVGRHENCKLMLDRICPPSVSKLVPSENYTSWFITGTHLDTFENVDIFICNEPCKITIKTVTNMYCSMLAGSIRNKTCLVLFNGTLEGQHYSLLRTEHIVIGVESTIGKAVALTVSLGVVLIVVLLIYITLSDKRDYDLITENLLELQEKFRQLHQDMDEEIQITLKSLKIELDKIGEGQFGIVHLALYTPKNGDRYFVACKKIKDPQSNFSEVQDFFRECKTTSELLHFVVQIAEGMAYLHSQNIIHRDLAARNCMLDAGVNVKIADFGLARECDADKTYTPKMHPRLPVAWTAIEIFTNLAAGFTMKADVWSYGVVLWEIFSQVQRPYGKLEGWMIVDYLKSGRRLEKLPNCPGILYNDVMMSCWSADPNDRKHFSELVPLVTEIYQANCLKNQSVMT